MATTKATAAATANRVCMERRISILSTIIPHRLVTQLLLVVILMAELARHSQPKAHNRILVPMLSAPECKTHSAEPLQALVNPSMSLMVVKILPNRQDQAHRSKAGVQARRPNQSVVNNMLVCLTAKQTSKPLAIPSIVDLEIKTTNIQDIRATALTMPSLGILQVATAAEVVGPTRLVTAAVNTRKVVVCRDRSNDALCSTCSNDHVRLIP